MVVIDMIKKISLVIPSQNAKKKLISLLESLLDSEIIPNEKMIVDSSEKNFEIPKNLQSLIKKLHINLQILYRIPMNLYVIAKLFHNGTRGRT